MQVRYLTNEAGEQVAVVLDVADYRQLLEDLEELESLKAYDRAKSDTGEAAETVDLEEALADIERGRV